MELDCSQLTTTALMGDQRRADHIARLLSQTTDHTLSCPPDTTPITHSVTQTQSQTHLCKYDQQVTLKHARSVKYPDIANTESIKHRATQTPSAKITKRKHVRASSWRLQLVKGPNASLIWAAPRGWWWMVLAALRGDG